MRRTVILFAAALLAPPALLSADAGSGALHGSVFTTDSLCDGERVHRFDTPSAVRLDSRVAVDPDESDDGDGAALPDGAYYVAVTDPKGNLLGSSVTASDPTPLHVVGGAATSCVDLSLALRKAGDGTLGFDTTSNRGGVYKVLVSTTDAFEKKSTVSRTFRVALRKAADKPNAD